MNHPLSKDDIRKLKKAFRMPSVQSMGSRKTTITNAFVSGIIPVVKPTVGEILEALSILNMAVDDMRCVYCGNQYTEWDHLRPLVIGRRPTGYISELANLVPACGKCNQSKGNAHWKAWMLGVAPRCPTARGVTDVAERVARLEAFERWRRPTFVDFEAIVGAADYAAYWSKLDEVITLSEVCQEIGSGLLARILAARGTWKILPPDDGKPTKPSH